MASFLLFLFHIITAIHCYQLELVSIVFRHGSRSPVDTYPKDPYREGAWPQGFGQLTPEGMREEYHLGGILKSAYIDSGYMNSNYTRTQIYTRSTDYDRTLMSAQCVLAGLYPPNEEYIPGIYWQPIPVHSVIGNDYLLRPGDSCSYYHQLLDNDKYSLTYQSTSNSNKHLFETLSMYTGMSVNLSSIWTLQDTLFVQDYNNLTVPVWYSDQLKLKLQSLADFTLSQRYNSHEKTIITGGVWANKVLTDMECKMNDTLKDMKLYLYSAHDTTVAAMLNGFGLFNGKQPLYSSAFIIELYSFNNNYYVRFLYHNGTWSNTLSVLHHPNCTSEYCPLNTIKQSVTRLTEDQLMQLCSTERDHSPSDTVTVIGLSVVMTILGILLIIAVTLMVCVFIKRRKTIIYNPINNDLSNEL